MLSFIIPASISPSCKMHLILKVLGVAVLAVVCGIPLYIDGYIIGNYLNDFLGYFCDVEHPVEDTSNIEWAKIMRGNASAIHEEFLAFEQAHMIPRIAEVSSAQHYLDHDPTVAWRSLFLRVYGHDAVHMQQFPTLQAAIKHVPEASTVMISILEPHYVGGAHYGVYRGIHRYLLGLEARKSETCCLLSFSFNTSAYIVYLWTERERERERESLSQREGERERERERVTLTHRKRENHTHTHTQRKYYQFLWFFFISSLKLPLHTRTLSPSHSFSLHTFLNSCDLPVHSFHGLSGANRSRDCSRAHPSGFPTSILCNRECVCRRCARPPFLYFLHRQMNSNQLENRTGLGKG